MRYDFSNCLYDRLYIVAIVLNYGPRKLLKSRYGPSLNLKKAGRPWSTKFRAATVHLQKYTCFFAV